MNAPPISPECRDRFKHAACAGQALDETTDEIVDCGCSCHVVPRDLPCSHPVRSSTSGLCLVCSEPIPPERRINT